MPNFTHNEIAAHYEDSGDGNPVVLLHAGGSSERQWRKMSAQLKGQFHLIAPDLFGFGKTPPWPGPGALTHDTQASLVRALIADTCVDSAHVVGHSYGGATAVRLWLMAPDLIRSLILIEPILTPLLPQVGEQELFNDYRSVAEGFLDRVDAGRVDEAWQVYLDLRNGEGTWRGMSDEARQRFIDGAEHSVAGFKSNLNNPTTLADCRSIRVPTMIICGSDTTAPERRVTEILRDAIPDCRYELIHGAGHMSPLTHPDPVAALIRDFLMENAKSVK